MTKPKLTLVHGHGDALYVGDKLLVSSYGDDLSALALLKALGYEVEHVHVCWQDMPAVDDGCPSTKPYAPASLADLKAHWARLRREKRRAAIESYRAQLARWEAEEAADVGPDVEVHADA